MPNNNSSSSGQGQGPSAPNRNSNATSTAAQNTTNAAANARKVSPALLNRLKRLIGKNKGGVPQNKYAQNLNQRLKNAHIARLVEELQKAENIRQLEESVLYKAVDDLRKYAESHRREFATWYNARRDQLRKEIAGLEGEKQRRKARVTKMLQNAGVNARRP